MNPTEKSWLENRIASTVADDAYLDRAEEKGIKEEAPARGFLVSDIELVLREVLDNYGAVSERHLVDTLDKWLLQSTDNDKKLDKKEERDSLDQVVRPAKGKKRGLDPRIAEDYVTSFCKVNGIVRSSDRNSLTVPLIIITLLAIVGSGAAYYYFNKPADVRTEVRMEVIRSGAAPIKLTEQDRQEIDDQFRRALEHVEASQFTDPPEKSAKACLDIIYRIDPAGTYRGEDVRNLVTRIVNQYLTIADRARAQNDLAGARKWIDRAKLFHADSEVIREKERALGLIPATEKK